MDETSVSMKFAQPGVNDADLEEEIMALCNGRTIDDMLSEVPLSGWCGLNYYDEFDVDTVFTDSLSPDVLLAFSPDNTPTHPHSLPSSDLDKHKIEVPLNLLDTLDSDLEPSIDIPHLDDEDLSWSPFFVDCVIEDSCHESGDDIENLCRLAAQYSPGVVPATSLPPVVQLEGIAWAQTEHDRTVEDGCESTHVPQDLDTCLLLPASLQLPLPPLCNQQNSNSESHRKRAWSTSASEDVGLSGRDGAAVSHSRNASVSCSPSPSHDGSPITLYSPSPVSPHIPDPTPGRKKTRKPLECVTPTNFDTRSSGCPGEGVVDFVDDAVKRAVRLVRNRASACDSRQRRKEYLKDMEKRCKVMEGEVTRLNRMVSTVCMENGFMREQLARFHCFPAPLAPPPGQRPLPAAALPPWAAAGTAQLVASTLIPAITPSSEGRVQGEGVVLGGGVCEKINGKIGVAEPAVLESDSLPLESLPLLSYPFSAPLLILLCLLLWAITTGQYSLVASLWPVFHLLFLLLATRAKEEGKERNRSSQALALLLGRLAFDVNKREERGSRRGRLREKSFGVVRVGANVSNTVFKWRDVLGWGVLGRG